MAGINASELCLLPFGGSGEIGLNANLYCYKGSAILVDLGVSFTDIAGIEVVVPDLGALSSLPVKLEAIFLTHAHEDHIGAVAYVWRKFGLSCPIYATTFAYYMLKNKLSERDIDASIHKVAYKKEVSAGEFSVTFLGITHSAPDSAALAIKTDLGIVVHTGDWKIDRSPQVGNPTDEESFKKLGDEGVLALVCDSTNAIDQDCPWGESEVCKELERLVGECENMVIVACFASNVARMLSCVKAAQKNNRKVVLAGTSLRRVSQIAQKVGYLDKTVKFISDREAGNMRSSEFLVIATGSQGEPRSALANMSRRAHPSIKIDNSTVVIFSSSVIPGNEKAVFGLQNRLIELGARIISERDIAKVHVSGHPSKSDLREMYSWIRPKIAVPIHGEAVHLQEHAKLAKDFGVDDIVIPKNGRILKIAPGVPRLGDGFRSGKLFVDGDRLIKSDGDVIKDRYKMMEAGVVFVTLVASADTRKVSSARISMRGISEDIAELEEINKNLSDLFKKPLFRTVVKGGEKAMKETVHKEISQFFNQCIGKKPMTQTQIVMI
ncbi:ribonuclease J [Candidatus Hydrogenosomobacter endosymbioticus]|uniref:MBL fold hydrolase n=1 Tax=Candidatus Hydrogenosomobacter endosymbioticus TaxID=2558174 RepID=A0ABM7V872_9PROT|nr:ribonuclease J [Candidatus Hydrogenosomobacter endosymbioticus]BDB95954.1 MBL fold hydrolase [Candidatus Hydrogenosomobacter endosymbioticus]